MQVSIHQPSLEHTFTDSQSIAEVIIRSESDIDPAPLNGGDSEFGDGATRKIEKWPLETTNGAHCEAVFGNGYSKEMLSCSAEHSSFQCLQNPFSNQMYCEALNFILNPSMISISDGGEDIAAVSGRKEDAEFPRFEHDASTGDTAFNVDCEPKGEIPRKNGVSYYMADIVSFLRNVGVANTDSPYHAKYLSDHESLCGSSTAANSSAVTIFLVTMRYEYANMYHQATDWYNFYQIVHSLGIADQYDIVFLDGHAASQIDEAWSHGLNRADFRFVKQINGGKPLCLKRAIFVSAGYVGGISLKTYMESKCRASSPYVQGFGPWFLKGFGLETRTERARQSITVTLTCRRDYVAHPRNMVGRATRKFHDDEAVLQKINAAVHAVGDEGWNYTVRAVAWSELTFREQLQVAATTDIFIGAHGAGLSHVLFLPPHSTMIEVVPNGFQSEPHFQGLSQWLDVQYAKVPGGSERAIDPNEQQLKEALRRHLDFIKEHV